jgi:hypothetical protein
VPKAASTEKFLPNIATKKESKGISPELEFIIHSLIDESGELKAVYMTKRKVVFTR